MGYMKNVQASAKSLIEHGIVNIAGANAPTNGETGKGVCGPGSLYFDNSFNDEIYTYQQVGDIDDPEWVAMGGANIGEGTVGDDAISNGLKGQGDGLSFLRVAKTTFNPSTNADQRTIGEHFSELAFPIGAIIVGGFYRVETTFTSATDAATIAASVMTANDIVSAVAISTGTPWDAGKKAIIPKANTPETTSVGPIDNAYGITFTVAVEALTAGLLTIWLYYVVDSND